MSGHYASPMSYRLRRYAGEGGAILLGAIIFLWSIAPIYNMWVIALDSHDDIFSGAIWPENPSLELFHVVVTEGFWYWSGSGTSSATVSMSG